MMKFAFAILVFAATTCGEDPTEEKEEDKSWEALNKKLKDLSKQVADLKMNNIVHHQAEAQIRDPRYADRKIRTANAKGKVSRQANPKRQDDVVVAAKQLIVSEIKDLIGAVKQSIVSEIKECPTTHNASDGLHDVIIAEIRKYFTNAELKQIETIDGAAKSESLPGGGYDNVLVAFRDEPQYCSGWDGSNYNIPFPHMVWYEFPSYHIPAKFTFRLYGQDSSTKQVPKTWKFVGSRDENCNQHSHWDELCGDFSGNLVYKVDVGCKVPKYAEKTAYKCLGIRIYSTTAAQAKSSNHNCFYNMRFWEAEGPATK